MAERRTITIAGRAISTMLAASGHNDVLRTYFVSQRDGVDYNLAYIGSDFVAPEKKGEFDQAYMRALYDYGYQQAKSRQGMAQGAAWPCVTDDVVAAPCVDRRSLRNLLPLADYGRRETGLHRRPWTPARARWKLRRLSRGE